MTSRAKDMNGTSKQMNSSGMIPKRPEHVATITDNEHLTDFITRMQQAPWLAVDTEFRRESTYYPELCLVQIAGNDEIGLIDILAVDDLAPLADLMSTHGPLKIFHAASQDIEVLHQTLGVAPSPLFDTQIAATLSGMGDQIGYAPLVEALTGARLPKGHTRMDWSRRPLPEQALTYAADDVRYLAVIYPELRDRLETLGRLQWAEADCAALTEPERFTPDPEAAWQRVRAWRTLEPSEQQVLACLTRWREQEAMRADRPRKWIVPDDALLALARKQPDDQRALEAIKPLPPKTAKRHGSALLESIHQGTRQPAEPLAPESEPLSDTQRRNLKMARKALSILARATDIAPPTLARRKDLEQLVTGERNLGMLRGWRAEVAGNAILDVVEDRQRIEGNGESARLVDNRN